MTLNEALVTEVRARVRDLRKRMKTTLSRMSAEDLSWRPNEESNSAGNLVVHLCGNLNEAIRVGFGDLPHERDIYAEFSATGPREPAELASCIDVALDELDRLLADLPPERLLEECVLPWGPKREGRRQLKVEVLLRAVTHVAEHLGQIIYIAKLRHGDGFASLSIPRSNRLGM